MTKRIAFALAVMLSVGACSAQTVATAVPAGAAATGASMIPAASPTVSLSALADSYLAIANKGNAGLTQCSNDVTAAGSDLAKLKVAAGECLAAENGFETDLGAARWGPVQPQVDDVIKASAKQQALWGQMANATSLTDYVAASQSVAAGSDLTGAVNVLRSALGLPPSEAITSPTEAPTSVATPATYQIGDTVTVTQDGKDQAKITITDVKVVASYKGQYSADKPKIAGNVFIQAKVAYEALTDGVSYNPYDWQVFVAGEAVQNYAFVMYGPEPGLSSGTLPNGRKASGYVVYEVAPAGEVRMSYKGSFLNTAPVFEVIIRPA